MTRHLVPTLLLVGLLAAGCGAGDDDDAASSDTFGDQATADSPNPASGGSGSIGTGDAESQFEEGADQSHDEGGDSVDTTAAPASDVDAEGGLATDGAVDSSMGEQSSNGFGSADPTVPVPEPVPVPGQYADYGIREFVDADTDPLSTFALDVDTGSYSLVRRLVDEGQIPPPEAIRVEEFVNSFEYDYEAPESGLAVSVDGAPSPFDGDNLLVRVGIQAVRIDDDARPAVNLTFVIDTSGSMGQEGRLELVKEALEELVDELTEADQVSIVTFNTNPELVIEPTSATDARVISAIAELHPDGTTNVEGGLALGYDMARSVFDPERVNRVIVLSDGIANVGVSDPDGLSAQIRGDADEGIQLVTVGVGTDGYNDVLMEQLADQGDGFYAYVDTEDEAERIFEDRLVSTLVTAAIDARVQVEFDPDVVEVYRLVGFENRGILDEDFTDDSVDAGELGAGHQVTALYEVELDEDADEIGTVNLRWLDPESGEAIQIAVPIDEGSIASSWGAAPADFRLAATVAALAEVLRDSPYLGPVDIGDIVEEADQLDDELELVEVAELADLAECLVDLGYTD